MKSKTSATYSYEDSITINYIFNMVAEDQDGVENYVDLYSASTGDRIYAEDLLGRYLEFDEKYYGPILASDGVSSIVTAVGLPYEMEGQIIKVYEKKSVTTTTYPPFYHKAKKGQSLYVKKNGAIGNEPDVYVKTGGAIKKLY